MGCMCRHPGPNVLPVRPHGTAIRDIRKGQNLGLRELARRTGLDRGYLSRLERGQIRNPGPGVLHRIAAALKVPVDATTVTEE